MGLAQYKFLVRVYIEDTDSLGVVYYVNYLKFLERARTEYVRHLGIEHSELIKKGRAFVVSSVDIKYLRPAYLDDELVVHVCVSKLGRASIHFQQIMYRKGDECNAIARALVRIGVVNTENFKPAALPEEYIALFKI